MTLCVYYTHLSKPLDFALLCKRKIIVLTFIFIYFHFSRFELGTVSCLEATCQKSGRSTRLGEMCLLI